MAGVGEAVWGLAVWLKDVTDLVNPIVRARHLFRAAQAGRASDDFGASFGESLAASEWRELVEVLGFDPSKLNRKQLQRVMTAAELIYADQPLRNSLEQFAKDYADAQHAIEYTHMAGAAVFELLLTLLLLAAGGVGAVANAASKLRQLAKFSQLGELLLAFAAGGKGRKLQPSTASTGGKSASLEDFEPEHAGSKARPVAPVKMARPVVDSKTKVTDKQKVKNTPIMSFDEGEKRLSIAREKIMQRKAAGENIYVPKYSDEQLLAMAENGETAKERFLVSVQPKSLSSDASLAYQRESGLVPVWTTSFDQLEAADTEPRLIHQVLGAESNFDPNKEYVMHIIDRGENLDNFGDNTIVPTWDKLADASVRELAAFDEGVIRGTMNSSYQVEYADKMKKYWDLGGGDFNQEQIEKYATGMKDSERSAFIARHNIRTEIGANIEFTGNGLTANSALGSSKIGIVETLTLERNSLSLSELKDSGIVKTINLRSL